MRWLALSLCLLVAAALAAEPPINEARARYHYQLHCQGCHTPDGSGYNAVPRMKGFVGYFLGTPEGREFLVRVPGAANAILPDEHLAELLNWMLIEFSGDSLAEDWEPYTVSEVRELRHEPLMEVTRYRANVISRLPIGAAGTGNH